MERSASRFCGSGRSRVGAADIGAVLIFAFYSLYSISAFAAQAFDLSRRFPRSRNRRNVGIVSVNTLRVNRTAEEIFAARCKSVEETFCGEVCGMIRRDGGRKSRFLAAFGDSE